jgi:hypothetical protein
VRGERWKRRGEKWGRIVDEVDFVDGVDGVVHVVGVDLKVGGGRSNEGVFLSWGDGFFRRMGEQAKNRKVNR